MEAERGNSLNGYSNFVHSDVLVPFRRESYPSAASYNAVLNTIVQ